MREMQKQVEQRKREKQADKLAREKVRQQIKQDQEERRAAQQKKSLEKMDVSASSSATQQVQAKPSAAEARIQVCWRKHNFATNYNIIIMLL